MKSGLIYIKPLTALFHQFGLIGEIQHVVPVDVIRYWNRNVAQPFSNVCGMEGLPVSRISKREATADCPLLSVYRVLHAADHAAHKVQFVIPDRKYSNQTSKLKVFTSTTQI